MAPRCIDLLWSQANYLDLEEASRINGFLEVIELLDWWRGLRPEGQSYPTIEEIRARLLALGRIEKEGRGPKRRVELVHIQPQAELGGTFSFSRPNAERLIHLGLQDARRALKRQFQPESRKEFSR